MQIKINPQYVTCYDFWESKGYGCIFVYQESDIDIVYNELCKQDDYWESYKNLIKVAPSSINSLSDLDQYVSYTGKTDIYDLKKLKADLLTRGIEILIFRTANGF